MAPFLLDKDSMCTDKTQMWSETWKSHKQYRDEEITK